MPLSLTTLGVSESATPNPSERTLWQEALGEEGGHIPFVQLLGFELVAFGPQGVEMAYTPQPEHLNALGVAHGGALMTLLDATMACAARAVEPAMGVVTVEMKTSFMQAASGPLRALGTVIHRTPTMVFTQATLWAAADKPCAHATGTFKFVRGLPVRQRG
jgi:uncharacterized protein (TIGR00369 family)